MEGKASLVVSVQSCFLLILKTPENLQHLMLFVQSLAVCYISYFLFYFSVVPESVREGGENKRQADQ